MPKESTNGRKSGFMRTHSFLDKLPFVNAAGAMKQELASAVIVSARIVALAKLTDLHYVYPELVSIVIANESGRVLAAYDSTHAATSLSP